MPRSETSQWVLYAILHITELRAGGEANRKDTYISTFTVDVDASSPASFTMASIPEKFHTSDVDERKVSEDQVEHIDTAVSDDPLLESLLGDERVKVERRLKFKLDTRLLPTIILIYILNYIDVRRMIQAVHSQY